MILLLLLVSVLLFVGANALNYNQTHFQASQAKSGGQEIMKANNQNPLKDQVPHLVSGFSGNDLSDRELIPESNTEDYFMEEPNGIVYGGEIIGMANKKMRAKKWCKKNPSKKFCIKHFGSGSTGTTTGSGTIPAETGDGSPAGTVVPAGTGDGSPAGTVVPAGTGTTTGSGTIPAGTGATPAGTIPAGTGTTTGSGTNGGYYAGTDSGSGTIGMAAKPTFKQVKDNYTPASTTDSTPSATTQAKINRLSQEMENEMMM